MLARSDTVDGPTTDRPTRSEFDERVAGHGFDERVAETLFETLAYARERDYRGWDYGDGMSSRLLQALPAESTLLNLAVQEVVKRTPVNVRPLLLVEQRRNYKGTALFAMANQTAHRLADRYSDPVGGPPAGSYLAETESLLEWLLEHRCRGYAGFCGGHRHEIQHLNGRKGVPNDPDVVSTSFAVKALLRGADLDPTYLETARSAARFVDEDLEYRPVEDGAVINYHLNHDAETFTVNAGALGARLYVDLFGACGDRAFRERAEALLDHVAGLQTDRGGWFYRDPPETSHLSMDNHHNGFVIECFQRHAEVTGSDRYADTMESALQFYRDELFDPDGAPNFDEDHAYPRDVHAAAQGILVFTDADDDLAGRIVEWTLANMYLGDGRFVFRKHRFHTKHHVLMRWCEAWMAYALAEYLDSRAD